MSISFQWPWMAILLSIPLAIFFLLPPVEHALPALRVPFFSQLNQYQQKTEQGAALKILLKILSIALWLSLVAAAMRPNMIGEAQKNLNLSRQVMLAVDTSQSMSTGDLQLQGQPVDRLSVVKSVLKKFIKRRQGEQLGLILFGSQAYLQTPFTFDRDTVQIFLDEAMIGIAGPQTAIGDAIGLAIKKMGDRDGTEQVLILLTDGQNNAGEMQPLEVAKLAAARQLKIYTIGVGASEVEVSSFFGKQKMNPSQDLDQGEMALKTISQITGGKYFRARNGSELEEIYSLIDQLEPVQVEQQSYRPTKALFYWPLAVALALSFLILALRNRHLLMRGRDTTL